MRVSHRSSASLLRRLKRGVLGGNIPKKFDRWGILRGWYDVCLCLLHWRGAYNGFFLLHVRRFYRWGDEYAGLDWRYDFTADTE